MQRNLNQDDFEQFLKENADNLRLKPSNSVWNNISKGLNKKRRRLTGFFVLALSLLSGSYFAWQASNLPEDNTSDATASSASKPSPDFSTGSTNKPPVKETASSALAASPKQTVTKPTIDDPKPAKVIPITSRFDMAKTALPNGFSEPAQAISEQSEATPETSEPTLQMQPTPTTIATLPLQQNVPSIQLSLSDGHKPQTSLSQKASDAIAASLKKNNRRLNWSVFITPTVSYRKLSSNESYQRTFLTPGTPPTVSALYNIKNAVTHKPDLGLEFGTMARYKINQSLKFRTGFQFNINRYDIKAFTFLPEVATIALNNGIRVDSVRAITNYRNFSGGGSNWLQNVYFQASVPIGLELNVAGNKKMQLSVASSIQPTYVIGNRSYMITADYKNYARVPWLTRRWNVNTNLETFVSYNAGKTQWHVGPQVRYQLLSSFVNRYPVKENLFDFGLKVGVTLK